MAMICELKGYKIFEKKEAYGCIRNRIEFTDNHICQFKDASSGSMHMLSIAPGDKSAV